MRRPKATPILPPRRRSSRTSSRRRATIFAKGATRSAVARMERSAIRGPRITRRCAALHPGYEQQKPPAVRRRGLRTPTLISRSRVEVALDAEHGSPDPEVGRPVLAGWLAARRPVLLKRHAQAHGVRDVAFQQRSPFHRPVVAARKIVVGDPHVAFRGQRLAGVTANVARAAGHEDVLRHTFPSPVLVPRKQFKPDPIIAAFRPRRWADLLEHRAARTHASAPRCAHGAFPNFGVPRSWPGADWLRVSQKRGR